MKVVQASTPTCSHDDDVEQIYEDVELTVRKVQTQCAVVMGDFNAEVGKKQAGEQAIGNYGIDSRKRRGLGESLTKKQEMKYISYSLPIPA